MLLGRSLYGGALYPRQVTAGGEVGCAAKIAANAAAIYRDGNKVFASSSPATAAAIRNVLPAPVAAPCAATVGARGKANFAAFAHPSGDVMAFGRARVLFAPSTVGLARADATGAIIRTIRMGAVSRTAGGAAVEGEAVNYLLAVGEAAHCPARVFGTTWFVGNVQTAVAAIAQASAQRVQAAAGGAVAKASVQVAGRCALYAEGVAASGVVPAVDPLHTAKGVHYWEARGDSAAAAALSGWGYVFTVALAVGFCAVTGRANTHRAAFATAIGLAALQARSEIVIPEQGRVRIESDAAAAGFAHFAAFGRAQINAVGATMARAETQLNAQAHAVTTVVPLSGAVSLAVCPRATQVFAIAASAEHLPATRDAAGAAASTPHIVAAARTRMFLAGTTGGAVDIAVDGAYHPKIPTSGGATATGLAVGTLRMGIRVAGNANAEAYPAATNKVNDAGQRLSVRVATVEAENRTLKTPVEPSRHIAVEGAARRLAA